MTQVDAVEGADAALAVDVDEAFERRAQASVALAVAAAPAPLDRRCAIPASRPATEPHRRRLGDAQGVQPRIGQDRRRRAVECDPPAVEREHAAADPRKEVGLLLGDEDRGPVGAPARRARPTTSCVPAGSSCAVGSSRTRWLGAQRQEPGDRHQLHLSARQAVRVAIRQRPMRSASRAALGAAQDIVAGDAKVHRSEGDLLVDRGAPRRRAASTGFWKPIATIARQLVHRPAG